MHHGHCTSSSKCYLIDLQKRDEQGVSTRIPRRYATKADQPAEVILDTSSATRLGLVGSLEQLQLWSSMITSKLVSPCEAAATLAGIPIVQKSTTPEFIPTYPPDQRSIRGGAETSNNVFLPPVDIYCGRPSMFHDMTLTQYFTKYTVNKQSLPSLGAVIAKDAWGNHIQARHPDQPIRFSTFNPGTDPEGFFYNILLQQVRKQ